MIVALWIIAICELIRIIQNTAQLMTIYHERDARDNAYAEFVKSLKSTDKEFVEKMLRGNGHIYRCPNDECDAPMLFKYDYCPKCGQAIKWKDGVEP